MKTLLYTHTDYSDVWKPFLSRFRKYFSDVEIYFCVNSTEQKLPEDIIPVYYDDNKTYTERLSQCIEQIGSTTVLFIHEDMILYDKPLYDKLEEYIKYVEEGSANSIKLIPVGTIIGRPELDSTLVHTTYSRFSIQPTIIHTDTLLELVKEVGKVSIWEFESLVKQRDTDYVAYTGTENKRGMYHYDSKVFPYTATAIVKGKWNFSEYPNELTEILSECGIDKEVRGVV
jgi:hypothetical protein